MDPVQYASIGALLEGGRGGRSATRSDRWESAAGARVVIAEEERRGVVFCRYVVRPNRSLTWAQAAALFGLCTLVSLGIGVAFHLRGLPLVLPFSGLEMLALGAALYVSMRRGSRQEVISIGPERVTLERGYRYPHEVQHLPRAWVQVVLESPPGRWHPSRLKLRSHGREVEIGTFLTEDERRALGAELARRLAPGRGEESAGGQPRRNDCTDTQAGSVHDHG